MQITGTLVTGAPSPSRLLLLHPPPPLCSLPFLLRRLLAPPFPTHLLSLPKDAPKMWLSPLAPPFPSSPCISPPPLPKLSPLLNSPFPFINSPPPPPIPPLPLLSPPPPSAPLSVPPNSSLPSYSSAPATASPMFSLNRRTCRVAALVVTSVLRGVEEEGQVSVLTSQSTETNRFKGGRHSWYVTQCYNNSCLGFILVMLCRSRW